MTDGTYRERWRDEVFRTSLVTDAVRVALLALLPEMDDSGRVEAPRPHLAARLGRSDRRVDDRLSVAIEAGFLEQVVRGGNGRTRTFQATLPDGSSETPGRPATGSRSRTPGGPAAGGVAGRSAAPYSGVGRRSTAHYSASSETPGGPTTDPGSETPGRPATSSPIYKAHARALQGGSDRHHQTPETARTNTTAPAPDDEKVSQSARQREAHRWLNRRYHGGLTEPMSAAVIAEVHRRAAKPIRSLVPYLAGMKDGDLADIVAAVMDAAEQGHDPAEPPGPQLAPVPDWCGHCDERTRLTGDPDRPRRCPTCHPLKTREAS